mmetsp:Transcript_1542/g.2725  ORF Transcript_1542/g.2725 Transcript_1542/m.2725 type:complete len:202 (+) Transcript_1542:1347-1952(+)
MLKKGMVLPSGVLTKILVARAPLLRILRCLVCCSPKMTLPKSMMSSPSPSERPCSGSMLMRAFLQVQMRGMLIWPVSERMGKKEWMSWLSWGAKVTTMVLESPADMRPVGVYWIWKKFLILSSSGSSLKELKEKETLVSTMVWVCCTPTTKSLKTMASGFDMNEVPRNSLPATIWGLTMPSFWRTIALAMYSCSRRESSGL